MPVRFAFALLLAATVARASVNPASHSHTDGGRLPSRWYHEEDHPVHNLFRRSGSNDGVTYAVVGTPGMFCVELLLQYSHALGRMVCGLSRQPRLHHGYASGVDHCAEQCRCGWQDTRYSHVHEHQSREPNVSLGL